MFNSEPTHLRYPVLCLKDKSRFPVHLFYRVPKDASCERPFWRSLLTDSPTICNRHHPSPLVPFAPFADAPARNGGMGTKKVIPWRSWKRFKIGYPMLPVQEDQKLWSARPFWHSWPAPKICEIRLWTMTCHNIIQGSSSPDPDSKGQRARQLEMPVLAMASVLSGAKI